MIVRDHGAYLQLICHTDHSALAGAFARAWGNRDFARAAPFASVTMAIARHDESWWSWEQHPQIDPRTAWPINFLDLSVPLHLAFYRGGIAVLLADDPYAGMLLSMHAAGIYTGRYGTETALTQSSAGAARAEIDAFVEECELEYGRLARELGVDEREQWINYRLIQVFDRLSLYFAMKDVEAGTPFAIAPAPTDYDGGEVELQIEPVAPWRVAIEPYPFAERPARFELPRRLLAKRSWPDDETFRAEYAAIEPERMEIVIE